MASPPRTQFGLRKPAPRLADAAPIKRSGHVALLLMGAFAVGGGAYALMPGQSCQPASPGRAAPAPGMAAPVPGMASPQANAGCAPRSSSSGSSSGYSRSSRVSFFGGGSSSTGDPASSGVTRGGFGSFARAFGFGSGG